MKNRVGVVEAQEEIRKEARWTFQRNGILGDSDVYRGK